MKAMNLSNSPYFKHTAALPFESCKEAIRIYLPSEKGYVNFNLLLSQKEEINCKTWRLGQAFALEYGSDSEFAITPPRAEWDMAVMIEGRPDFIGGFAHGDECFSSFRLFIDGKEAKPLSEDEIVPFSELRIFVDSVGFDPLDGTTPALIHKKEYIVDKTKIRLEQRVEWLNDYSLGSSYLAMMPPIKALTTHYVTNLSEIENQIKSGISESGVSSLTLYGKDSGFSFKMSIPKYLTLPGSNQMLITDNGGNGYNKMYFFACKGARVFSGDVWETVTEYEIHYKDF